MTKFGAAENKMERLTAKFAQRTPTEQSLFIKAISDGIFPSKFKVEQVIPIPKVFPPEDYGDIRPLSMTLFFSKKFEEWTMFTGDDSDCGSARLYFTCLGAAGSGRRDSLP